MSKPNFVFIMTDSQGANDIGVYGRTELSTPHLDKLASQSIRFQSAYSTCPVCGPARSALFTGEYPHSAGVWANEMPLASTAKTMGQRFQDAGYDTAYIGKWHLSGQDYFDTGICPPGWNDDYWYDGRRYLAELNDEQIHLWRQVLSTTDALLKHDVPAEFTWGNRISQRARKFLQSRSRSDEPFLLALSYDEPHGPCTCPKSYVEKFKDYIWDPGPNGYDTLQGKPAFHRRLQELARNDFLPGGRLHYPPFFACNSFVDAEIGSVLEWVDQYAPENTYVIFTSDHGQFKGAHGLTGKGHVMYDESARIPLFIRQPGHARAGTVHRTPVSHIDLLPTMLDLAGLDVSPSLQGGSLKQQLHAGVDLPAREVVIEWNRGDVDANGSELMPARCMVNGRYKLSINLFDLDELYDLHDDPHELQNRIDDERLAAVRDELHEKIALWMNRTRDPFRGEAWAKRPWRTTPLPALYKGATVRLSDGYMPPTLHYMTGKP